MKIRIAGCIGFCGIVMGLLLASGVFAGGSQAALPSWLLCAMAREADKLAVEKTLTPASGSTVEAGTPVTFSGGPEPSLSFAIASSPALLSTPDIDGGPGIAGPPQQPYTFTSTKASATPRTIYWQASFSTAGIPECASEPSTITTEARTLTVVPTAPPPPSPSLEMPAAPKTSPLEVGIGKPTVIGGPHGAGIAYEIHCNQECTGRTSYQVLILRRHARPRRTPELGAAGHVTVAAASGGQAQVEQRYRGAALRAWTKAVHAGEAIEVRVVAEITSSSDETVERHRSFSLRL
jgi:hypothetical protein